MDTKKKEYSCKECEFKCTDKLALEKHVWKEHPKDIYQKAWTKIDFHSYSGNSFYADDPYY